jgi:hypothetical protein
MNTIIILLVLIIIIAIVFIAYTNGKMGGGNPIIYGEFKKVDMVLDRNQRNTLPALDILHYDSRIDELLNIMNKGSASSSSEIDVLTRNVRSCSYNRFTTFNKYVQLMPNFLALSESEQTEYLRERYGDSNVNSIEELIKEKQSYHILRYSVIHEVSYASHYDSNKLKRNVGQISAFLMAYKVVIEILTKLRNFYAEGKCEPEMEYDFMQLFNAFNNAVSPKDKLILINGSRTKAALRTQHDDDDDDVDDDDNKVASEAQ